MTDDQANEGPSWGEVALCSPMHSGWPFIHSTVDFSLRLCCDFAAYKLSVPLGLYCQLGLSRMVRKFPLRHALKGIHKHETSGT